MKIEPKNMKESVKLHMVCVSPDNDKHLVPKTITTLHSTSLHLSTLHFFPFKLYPSTLHYTSLHFTNLSFVLNIFKFPSPPFQVTSHQ